MTIKPKKQNLKSLFIFNALLLIVAFAVIQYSVVKHEDGSIPDTEFVIKPDIQGDFAKGFALFDTPQDFPNIEFKTSFDKNTSLNDLKGQWVILNFWATWCPPCLVEMPSLQSLQGQYGGYGIKVIAISLDRNMGGKRLRDFMNKHKFGPVAAHYGDWTIIKKQAGLAGLPTTYILSPNGQAIGVYKGDTDWVSDDSKLFIESLIQK